MLFAFFLKKVKLVFASHELASKNNRPVPGCPVLLFNSTVLLLTFKALNNLAPPYLSQLIVPYNPTRNLRSASKHLLEVPNVRLKSYGDRAFSVAAPKHWNDIPLDIKLSGSVDVFKSRLKTYLFRLAFS